MSYECFFQKYYTCTNKNVNPTDYAFNPYSISYCYIFIIQLINPINVNNPIKHKALMAHNTIIKSTSHVNTKYLTSKCIFSIREFSASRE